MGKITNVLNKVQESRQFHQDQKLSDFLYVRETRQVFPKKVEMVMVAVIVSVTTAAIVISNKISHLERSVKMQEKRFDDLSVFLSDTKSLSDNQIQDFNSRLKNEAEDRKIQISKLDLIDNVYYLNLIKYIHANTLRINSLDKNAQDLKSKIEKISASESQSKDLSSSPSVN